MFKPKIYGTSLVLNNYSFEDAMGAFITNTKIYDEVFIKQYCTALEDVL